MESSKKPIDHDALHWNPALEVSQQSQAGETVYVLSDPDSGDHFQLGEAEYRIARLFDGKTDLEEIRAELSQSGESPELHELREFAEELFAAGLLVVPGAEATPASLGVESFGKTRTSLIGRLLYVPIKAMRPQRFFEVTTPWVKPFMTPAAFVASGFCVALALHVMVSNWGALSSALPGAFSAKGLLAFWFWYGVIVLIHEMAHGYACAYYGGRVRALGFLLMYGRPCAYCDVSDAWLFPRKSQKILVMAAGTILELVVWAVATLVWRVTAPETVLHATALIIMMVAGIGILFNFNPLLKFDGYYMLSDALEIPNLRARAFRDLRNLILARPREARTECERWLFPTYGIAALAYSVFILGFILLRLNSWMGQQWGALGVTVLWLAVLFAVNRPLVDGLRAGSTTMRELSVSKKWMFLGSGLALLAVLVLVRWPLKVSAESEIVPLARVVLRAETPGSVRDVAVVQGTRVEPGQTILKLDVRDQTYELEAARATVAEIEAKLRLLKSGARQQELEVARRRAEAARARLSFQQKAHERALQSLQSDLVSRQSVEEAERSLRVAEGEERAASQEVALLEEGALPDEVRAMESQLEANLALVQRLEEEIALAEIRSPIAGTVLTPHVDRLQGGFVERGDSLMVIADLSEVILEIPVPEKEVGDVALGARVRFKARSYPGIVFEGSVTSIAPGARVGDRQRTIIVRSRIDNPDRLLLPEASGFAKIYCGERALGSILSRRAVRMLRTEFWALW